MRYWNYKCDGCNEVFSDTDDVVVCPVCATPQHRECYNRNNCCVNSHLHSEGFEWKGEKTVITKAPLPTDIRDTEVKRDLICPNCHYANPHGSTECEKCGLKFTIFGINLAEKAQEAEEPMDEPPVRTDIEPKMTPPDYPPPFTVGNGENEEEREALPSSREEQMGNFLSQTISNASGYNTADSEEILFKGPFPDDMKIDGIPANTMGAFLARDSGKYIRKFRSIASGNRISFNWAAFFLSPYWFFYRKMYKPGIIFMTIQICINIIMTPAATEYLSFYEYLGTLDSANLTEAAMADLFSRMNTLMEPMAIFFGVMFALHLIAGFAANHIYRKYTVNELQKVAAEPNRNHKLTRILKYGGISPLMPLVAYFAEQMLSMLAGSFF